MTNQFLITTTSSTSPTTTIHSLVPGQSGGQPIRNTPLVVVGAHSINPITDQYSAGSGLRQYTELITAGAIILDHSPRSSWLLNNVVVEPRISNGCVITRIGHEGRSVRVNESKLLSMQRVLAIFNIRKSEAFGRLQIDIRDDKGNIHILKLDLGTDYITSITICFRKAIRASTTQEETSPIVITEQIQTTSFDSLLGFIDIRGSVGNIHTLKPDINPRHINSICTSKSRGGKSGNTSSTIDERHAMKRKVDELNVKFSQLDIKKSKTQGFCSKFSSLTLQETEDTQEETSNPIILAPEQIQHILFNSASDSFELYDIL